MHVTLVMNFVLPIHTLAALWIVAVGLGSYHYVADFPLQECLENFREKCLEEL